MSRRPKRRKKSAAARLRPFWILFILVAAAGAAGAYYAATWPGFYPKRVSVRGNHVVPTAQILSRAAIAPHQNVWLQNMRAASARIEAIPYVKTAAIHRTLPASVRIDITERAPFAVLQTSDRRVLVDGELRVLKTEPAANSLPLIVVKTGAPADGAYVRDPDAAHLAADYRVLAASHVAVRALEYDRFGDLVANTPGGIALLLGDDGDLAKKTTLIDPIISQVSATGKKLAAVDLRAPGTPVVVYKH